VAAWRLAFNLGLLQCVLRLKILPPYKKLTHHDSVTLSSLFDKRYKKLGIVFLAGERMQKERTVIIILLILLVASSVGWFISNELRQYWGFVLQFNGGGRAYAWASNVTTEQFVITASAWRIDWGFFWSTSTNASQGFEIVVHDANTTGVVTEIVSPLMAHDGSIYMILKGKFYLQVFVPANLLWYVSVLVDLR
jgi:hypothetical protein